MDNKTLLKNIDALLRKGESEIVEYKENWFEPDGVGEYISALSNSAALLGEPYGYLIWGIYDKDRSVTGTSFSEERNVKGEPFLHYLRRQIKPDLEFSFHHLSLQGKEIVCLLVDASESMPTSYKKIRYIRIGSSKVELEDFPAKEDLLHQALRASAYRIENLRSSRDDLSFKQLFTYYAGRGIELRQSTFKKNLRLLDRDGNYNRLAELLSDDSGISIRVSVFGGKDKTAPLISVREFGRMCLLLSLDKILEYGDVVNIIQADERNRVVERKDVPLFDAGAFREAVINALLHNKWADGNGPMVSIFSDRIEILSRGSLPRGQTLEGFFEGESVPVNEELAHIFMQLHISEQSGRGVPKIVSVYGRNCYSINENSIAVTIPFSWIRSDLTGNGKKKDLVLSKNQAAILSEIRENPHVTNKEMSSSLSLGINTVEKNVGFLKKCNLIERIGSKKTGYWAVLEPKAAS